MQTSESIKAIAPALAKAQAKMGPVLKNETNPHFRKKYADLSAVADACRGALTGEGIAIFQSVEKDESGAAVETVLLHSSGEWIKGRVPLLLQKQDMQGLGSAMTYGRRYGLLAACNLAPEDDDGNAASERPSRPSAQQEPPFDATAAADRIIASLTKAEAVAALDEINRAELETVEKIKATSPDDAKRLILAYRDRKAALTPKEQAA